LLKIINFIENISSGNNKIGAVTLTLRSIVMFLMTSLARYHAVIAKFFSLSLSVKKNNFNYSCPSALRTVWGEGWSALTGNPQHRGENPLYRKHTNNHHAKLKTVPSS